MIDYEENEAKMKNRLHSYDINRPKPRHGLRYTKYKMCHNKMMVICFRKHLNNIWSSTQENVKHLWCWVEAKYFLLKKAFNSWLTFYPLAF